MRHCVVGLDLSVTQELSPVFWPLTLLADPIDSAKSIYQRNCLMYSRGQKVPPVKIEFFRRHMYRGLGVSMGRSCVVNAVFFSSFEFLKKHINAIKDTE